MSESNLPQRPDRDGYDLVQDVERLMKECAQFTVDLTDILQAKGPAEVAYLEAEKVLVIIKGKERLTRLALSGANRELIAKQSLLKTIPR